MTAIAFLLLFVAVLVLAGLYGKDSRVDRPGRQL